MLGSFLGSLGDAAFAKTMQMSDYDWTIFLTRPFCAFFIGAGLLSLGIIAYRSLKTISLARHH